MGVMKRLVLLLLVLGLTVVFSGTALAQTGKVVGRVVDAESGEPLIGTNVVIEGTKLGASTDLDGIFFILNVPPGTYTVTASMLGYQKVSYENVRVNSGLTTNLNFELPEAVLEAGEAVTYVAERPMIKPDMTESRSTRTSEDIELMPVNTVQQVIQLTAGTVGDNFRGGRSTEVNYLVDGASMVDPMTGNHESNIPLIAFEEINVVTGGMSAEYGNALSGVVSQVTKEGGQRLNGQVRYRTNDLMDLPIGHREQKNDIQASLGGPVPFFPSSLGDMNFFASGQWYDTRGVYPNNDLNQNSFFGKLTYKITPQSKIMVSGSFSNSFWTNYYHAYSRTTREDRLEQFSPVLDSARAAQYVDPQGNLWFDNGRLDTEDLNGNNQLDPGEDLDGDGVIDSEDLNHNGGLDSFDMLNHTPYFQEHTNSFTVKWNHATSSKTFWEISANRYRTAMHYNVREQYNEDSNGNGRLDLEPSYGDVDDIPAELLASDGQYLQSNADQTFFWFDYNGNGTHEYEDINGNGIWDWKKYGPDHDLLRDENNDRIVDASEGTGNPMLWDDVQMFGNTLDQDNFFTYGTGKTYYRLRWNNDEKVTWTYRGTITSQVHRYHQIKAGAETKFFDISDFDIDMASGGNVYGTDIEATPRLYSGWVEDKMEFEGMVVNLGMRVDVFDANWDMLPADPGDPVNPDGTIKNPTSTDIQTYWSPRLGVAFPITERDLLSFNYNRNFQIPIMLRLYDSATYDALFRAAFPIIGNPTLEPERTAAYEITLRHMFTDDLVLVATGFYKDISGLVDNQQVFWSATNWYGYYVNQDYGNARGFELSLEKRFSNFYSGNINYTYSVAKGKSSSTRQGYDYAYNGYLPRTTESYLDWDQRHTINANVQFMIPRGTSLWGQSWLDEVSASFLFEYGSGLPYSSPSRSIIPPVNDKRLPAQFTIDGRIQKRFSFTQNLGAYVYLAGYNLTNEQNIDQDFFQASGDIELYEARGDVDGAMNNPTFWERDRYWELGLGIEF